MDEDGTPDTGFKTFAQVALLAIVVILLFVFLWGLTVQAPVPGSTPNWTLVSYRDTTGILVPVINKGDITARFGQDGNVTGFSGCNPYVADFLENGKQMRITAPLHTTRTCADPGIMQQEEAYYHDLAQAASVQNGPSEIDVFDADGNTLLVFWKA